MQSSKTQSCRTPSYHLKSPVVKCFSPSASSSPRLSSAPGNLKKLFPAVVVTHGVARAHGQSKLVLQPSSCQFYQIPSPCAKIWLQQSCPSHRGALLYQLMVHSRVRGLVCWNVLVAELGDTWGQLFCERLGGTTAMLMSFGTSRKQEAGRLPVWAAVTCVPLSSRCPPLTRECQRRPWLIS